MTNRSARLVLGAIGAACFVLAAIGLEAAVNLFYLGWAFVVAAWLAS